jgi:hypothetical protein
MYLELTLASTKEVEQLQSKVVQQLAPTIASLKKSSGCVCVLGSLPIIFFYL